MCTLSVCAWVCLCVCACVCVCVSQSTLRDERGLSAGLAVCLNRTGSGKVVDDGKIPDCNLALLELSRVRRKSIGTASAPEAVVCASVTHVPRMNATSSRVRASYSIQGFDGQLFEEVH